MFDTQAIIDILVLPVAAAIVIGGILFLMTRGRDERAWPNRLGGLVIFATYAVGQFARFQQPNWSNPQSVDAWRWILPCALAATLVLMLDAWLNRAWIRWTLRPLLIAALAATTLQPFIRHTWDPNETATWMIGITIVGTIWWALVEAAGTKIRGNWFAGHWLLVTFGGGAILVLSGSQTYLELMIMLGAGVGVCMILQMLGKRALAAGLFSVAPLIVVGVFLNGRFFLDMAWWRVITPIAAPLACLVPGILLKSDARPLISGMLRTAAVGLALAGAVVPAIMAYDQNPYSGGY
ncbi:MAG: hypothetical protein KF841_09360 [Phycisphaerae bacterium]|nr:hypothetical protein [Phycisphaerae bacterium]